MFLKAAADGIGLRVGKPAEIQAVADPGGVFRGALGQRQVPLADHRRRIAGCSQRLGDGHRVRFQTALVTRRALVEGHAPHARLVRIQPGQQRRAGRTAARSVVEVREAQAVRGEPVEVRSLDLAAVTAGVRVAHIVGHDDHDIGPGVGAKRGGGPKTARESARNKRNIAKSVAEPRPTLPRARSLPPSAALLSATIRRDARRRKAYRRGADTPRGRGRSRRSARRENLVFIQAPNALEQPLAPQNFMNARNAAREVVARIENRRVASVTWLAKTSRDSGIGSRRSETARRHSRQ